MFTLLLFLISFQQTQPTEGHDEHNHSDENMVYFQPLSVGAVVQLKNFQITIPEGTFYATEENVPLMLPLTGAKDIPQCVGMFYSNSNNWDYNVIVQHFPDYAFKLEPAIEANIFTDFFQNTNLYRLSPFNGQADVVIPPTYQREENSFTLGMQYTEEDHTLVIIKKVYVSKHGALILSYKANDKAFVAEPEAIDRIMNSVTINQDFTDDLTVEKAELSYLELLGFKPNTVQVDDAVVVEEGLDPKILVFSGAFALIGIALLIVAVKMRKT